VLQLQWAIAMGSQEGYRLADQAIAAAIRP